MLPTGQPLSAALSVRPFPNDSHFLLNRATLSNWWLNHFLRPSTIDTLKWQFTRAGPARTLSLHACNSVALCINTQTSILFAFSLTPVNSINDGALIYSNCNWYVMKILYVWTYIIISLIIDAIRLQHFFFAASICYEVMRLVGDLNWTESRTILLFVLWYSIISTKWLQCNSVKWC